MVAVTSGLAVRCADSFQHAPPAEAWNDLLSRSSTNSVFLTREWQEAWWETFERGRLAVVSVHDDDVLVALAPLFLDGGMAFPVGAGGSDQLDLLGDLRRRGVARALLQAVFELDPGLLGMRLYHVPQASTTPEVLAAEGDALDLVAVEEESLPAPQLDLIDSTVADAVVRKKSLVRHENGLRRDGHVEVVHLSSPEEIADELDALFEQHVARWRDTPHPSLFEDPSQRTFYRRLVARVGPTGRLRLTSVLLDGRAVAMHFGTFHGGTFLWYKPAFDIELARRSPGEVLLRQLLLRAVEEGATTFDFGIGDEAFKQRFATATPVVRTWGVYPRATVERGAP